MEIGIEGKCFMRDLLEALYGSLKEEEKVLEQIISTTQDMAGAFQENNLTEIRKLTEKQGSLTSQFQMLFEKRCLTQEKLKTRLGLPVEATLTDILTLGADDKEDPPASIISRIKDRISILSQIVFTNCLLLKQALDFNERLLRLLNPENRPVYREKGRLKEIKTVTALNRMA